MDYKLTPNDLEIGKEYNFNFHIKNKKHKKHKKKVIKCNGTYAFIHNFTWFNRVLLYKFKNEETQNTIIVAYNDKKLTFVKCINYTITKVDCDIIEITNEYVLK